MVEAAVVEAAETWNTTCLVFPVPRVTERRSQHGARSFFRHQPLLYLLVNGTNSTKRISDCLITTKPLSMSIPPPSFP